MTIRTLEPKDEISFSWHNQKLEVSMDGDLTYSAKILGRELQTSRHYPALQSFARLVQFYRKKNQKKEEIAVAGESIPIGSVSKVVKKRFIWNTLQGEETLLSAQLCWWVYNAGQREFGTPGARSLKEVVLSPHPIAQDLKKQFSTGRLSLLKDDQLRSFIPADFTRGHQLQISNGILSIDDYQTCGFLISTDKKSHQTLNIVFRGTELEIGVLKSIHRYFLGDYMRMSRHYEVLQPAIKNALEFAAKNKMSVNFTGHSLGASMAQLAMNEVRGGPDVWRQGELSRMKMGAIVFGSPGARHIMEGAMKNLEQWMDIAEPVFRDTFQFGQRQWIRTAFYNMTSIAFNLLVLTNKVFSGSSIPRSEPFDHRIISIVNQKDLIPKLGHALYHQGGVVCEFGGNSGIPLENRFKIFRRIKEGLAANNVEHYVEYVQEKRAKLSAWKTVARANPSITRAPRKASSLKHQ